MKIPQGLKWRDIKQFYYDEPRVFWLYVVLCALYVIAG